MQPRINDFVLKFANVNGSGSASANLMCAKTLFRMGVPVSPKNIFPSNIQGLPTWYEITVSEAGRLSRRDGVDLMVAMNPQSYAQDVAEVVEGGALLYDSSRERDFGRDDITVIGLPIAKICAANWNDSRQRQLFKNMVYLGALVTLVGLDAHVIEGLIAEQFRGKDKLIAPNVKALHLGRDAAAELGLEPLPIRAAHAKAAKGKIMIQGNEAAGIGALYAGATVASWYPITPSTSMVEGFEKHARKHRVDEDGKLKAAVIQAEDELAAVGMAIGAAWNGARSFTATSGPGISLMNEFIGLAYFSEIPLVLFNIQRGGPSTGMPTRTQQSDILMCAYASHGDTGHILLFPGDPKECFEMAADAFDIAEHYQTPVFVMSDLDIGMNDWMVDPLEWDDARKPNRGKVLTYEELEAGAEFARYRDVDGDGVPYRTYPGVHPERGAYFTRGTSHTDTGGYTEDGRIHAEGIDRIKRKILGSADALPQPVIRTAAQATTVGVINVGSTCLAIDDGLALLEEGGHHVNAMRIRAFPFSSTVAEFVEAHDIVFVVEQNRDAQLRHLLIAEAELDQQKLVPVLNYDGMPLTADFIRDAIAGHLTQAIRISAE
ncbi:MAG: 2-oxoacid:acceptor oxidoreductase subunit alpha [Pseudomonadota bacterium]